MDSRLVKLKLKQLQKQISFDEELHEYWLGKHTQLEAVSRIVQKVVPKFDASGEILRKCADKEGIPEPELKARWELKKVNSMDYGTKFHAEAEMVIHGCEQHLQSKCENLSQVNLVYLKLLTNVIDTEVIVFNKEKKIAGTIDLITMGQKGLILWDWKTNEKIEEEGYGYLLPPCDALKNSTLNKYILSMGLYRWLLEQQGFEVESMNLIHIPNGKMENNIIQIPYMRDYIEKLIEA